MTQEDDADSRVQQQAMDSLREAEAKLTDHITRLETDINKATPNMRAGERLAATETRLKEVDEHFAETRKRAAAAKKAFEDIKQKRYDLFMKAFNHISENIGGTYKDLTKSPQFPLGGQAYLDMEDSTEPYLAGLKYHAMPPLKRFRDMEHLSGGEKTIAALALLFAIHSYQPSPFFVLDEVDAALDHVNVSRVAQYVREHASPGMQFIVISLKSTFFQESETLVGVMRDQAKMTSKYLSLDVGLPLPFSITTANQYLVEEIRPRCAGCCLAIGIWDCWHAKGKSRDVWCTCYLFAPCSAMESFRAWVVFPRSSMNDYAATRAHPQRHSSILAYQHSYLRYRVQPNTHGTHD